MQSFIPPAFQLEDDTEAELKRDSDFGLREEDEPFERPSGHNRYDLRGS